MRTDEVHVRCWLGWCGWRHIVQPDEDPSIEEERTLRLDHVHQSHTYSEVRDEIVYLENEMQGEHPEHWVSMVGDRRQILQTILDEWRTTR